MLKLLHMLRKRPENLVLVAVQFRDTPWIGHHARRHSVQQMLARATVDRNRLDHTQRKHSQRPLVHPHLGRGERAAQRA